MLYSTLAQNEFRLITLHSRSSSAGKGHLQPREQSPISCKVFPKSRDESPDYQALSYTWGDTTNKVSIQVNNEDFPVTRDLRTALEHIRDDNDDITLWIDAISINQADDREKSEQVAKMKDIYAKASNTRVWLGPADEDSDEVIAELNRIGDLVVKTDLVKLIIEVGRLRRNWDDRSAERYQELEKMKEVSLAGLFKEATDNLPHTTAFLTSSVKLFSREYWKRVWILQELVVSSRIIFQCGTSNINIDRMYACMIYIPHLQIHTWHTTKKLYQQICGPAAQGENLDEKKLFLQAQLNSLGNVKLNNSTSGIFGTRLRYQESLTGSAEGLNLIQLLAKVNVAGATEIYSHATDNRDRIFALLGMATDSYGIVPEYDRRISCSDIYTKAAHAIIESGEIDLLSLSQNKDRQNDIPSWVPDWRSKWILRPSGQLPWDTAFNACSSYSEDTLFKPPTDGKPFPAGSLILNGYQVDVIDTLRRPWTPHYIQGCTDDTPAVAMYLLDIAHLCTESEIKVFKSGVEIYADISDRRTAHIRVPVADQEEYSWDNITRRATEKTHRGYEEVMQDVVNTSTEALNRLVNPNNHPLDLTSHMPSKAAYFNMMGWQRDRRPFLSEKGYVGLAPVHVQEGDVVVLFLGAKFPYVIRKKDCATYTFVGEAYVHGIMYGEFMKNEVEVRTFTLV